MSVLPQKKIAYSKRNRRKPLIYFFKYVIHADYCQRGKIKDPVKDSYNNDLCKSELCMYVDQVISHKTLMDCESNESCNVAACLSSSKTLSHCKECSDSNCFICLAVKRKGFCDNGENNTEPDSISELRENFGNLNLLCGLYGLHSKKATAKSYCSCRNPVCDGCENLNKVCLPAGLTIEAKEATSAETKDWHFSFTAEQRNSQISGFFRTMISKTDTSVLVDKRLFYFLSFVTTIEKKVYESSDSKGEYIRNLLEKIKEIDEEFRNYREIEENSSVQNAAEKFFKDKIGNDELGKEVQLPNGLTYTLEAPITEETTKAWQKSFDPFSRESIILKTYVNNLDHTDHV